MTGAAGKEGRSGGKGRAGVGPGEAGRGGEGGRASPGVCGFFASPLPAPAPCSVAPWLPHSPGDRRGPALLLTKV